MMKGYWAVIQTASVLQVYSYPEASYYPGAVLDLAWSEDIRKMGVFDPVVVA